MKKIKQGFTMIELVFVILILGILSAVALPKLAATRDDAKASEITMKVGVVVSDISSYVVSKGEVLSDFSSMSSALKALVNNGEATVGSKTAIIKVNDVDCITILITTISVYENLSVSAVSSGSSDYLCSKVQNAIALTSYNIPLVGAIITP